MDEKKMLEKIKGIKYCTIQDKQKKILLEQIKKIPIIQLACERTGISRSTFYRWCDDDEKFANEYKDALVNGKQLINDLAESKLISNIHNNNMQAITFWLKHKHSDYKEEDAKSKLMEDDRQFVFHIRTVDERGNVISDSDKIYEDRIKRKSGLLGRKI